MQFTTWGRTHTCTPTAWARPRDEAEVAEVVRSAAARGQRVKALGAGHSWSDAALTDGVMVSLDALDAVTAVDGQRGRVTVQAGKPLHAFNDALASAGLALPIVGSIAAQRLGGLLATGTHGSSLRHGNLSTNIVAMRIVDGHGDVVALEEGDPRLPGARVALGALGIVTEVTLHVDRAFTVAETIEPMPLDAALERLPTLASESEYVKLWWIPHTDTALVFRGARVDEAPTFSERARRLDERLVNGVVLRALLGLGARVPALIPALNRVIAASYFRPRRAVGRSDRVLSLAMPPRHRESEWAVPAVSGPALIRHARELVRRRDLRVNFIFEARFVKGDDTWMSPAYGRDSMQTGAYTACPRDCRAWFDGFAEHARALDGRPHWGKEGVEALDPTTVRRMWPRADDFAALVRAFDPDGTFRNPFVDRIVPR